MAGLEDFLAALSGAREQGAQSRLSKDQIEADQRQARFDNAMGRRGRATDASATGGGGEAAAAALNAQIGAFQRQIASDPSTQLAWAQSYKNPVQAKWDPASNFYGMLSEGAAQRGGRAALGMDMNRMGFHGGRGGVMVGSSSLDPAGGSWNGAASPTGLSASEWNDPEAARQAVRRRKLEELSDKSAAEQFAGAKEAANQKAAIYKMLMASFRQAMGG